MMNFRAMSGAVASIPSGPPGVSIIKSIQTGIITIAAGSSSNTATMSSVNTANSILIFNGMSGTNPVMLHDESYARMELTNATTVTAVTNSVDASYARSIRFTLVEFEAAAISSIQTGTITMNAALTNTATISSVNTSRACVLFYGQVTDVSSRSMGSNCVYLQLTNATTVTASHQTAAGIVTVGYAVVEFASGVTQSVQEQKIIIPANTLSTTATISSVNMSSCLLLYGGWGMHTPTTTIPDRFPIAYLSNATTIAATRAATSNTQPAIVVTAVEFDPAYVASKQAGQTAIASTTSVNVTISSVNTAKTLLSLLHHKFPASSTDMGDCYATGEITGSTNLALTRGSSIATALTASWEVMEFV